jgi:hypothetical protein
MSVASRNKSATSLRAPATMSSDTADLKARFVLITQEIAAELRIASDRITHAVIAIAAASDDSQRLREAVYMAVSIAVLQTFLQGVSDRISSFDVGHSEDFQSANYRIVGASSGTPA